MPAVLQPDDAVAELGAGDQVEPVGLGVVVETARALARDVGVQVHAELVDQIEPLERTPISFRMIRTPWSRVVWGRGVCGLSLENCRQFGFSGDLAARWGAAVRTAVTVPSDTAIASSTPEEAYMGVFNGVFPIHAGKEDDARAFAAETFGVRRPDFEAHLARGGITRETWSLQETPMGNLMVVWFEGDVEKAFADLATHDSEYMTWFRAQVLDVTGVDLAAPSDAPPPAVLIDYRA